MAGLDDSYAGVVIDTADPTGAYRVRVEVPQLWPSTGLWARPERTDVELPAIGDEVAVRFESGDANLPLWSPGAPPTDGGDEADGPYGATYAATVLDVDDPVQARRVLVLIPEIGPEETWADAEDPYAASPLVGEQVWIRFAGGDPAYPVWVGPAD